jgi:hypothetical protein
LCGDQNRQRLWPTGSDGVTCLHKWLFAQEIPFQPAKMASVREMLLACATTSRATTSRATPSRATPSRATTSRATPSRATPSRATPSRATPFQPAERSGCGTFRLRNVSGCGTFPAAERFRLRNVSGCGSSFSPRHAFRSRERRAGWSDRVLAAGGPRDNGGSADSHCAS